MARLVRKLIWQQTAPAPFESGWSVFSKLLLLNQIKPSQLASLLQSPDVENNNRLRFRNSDWIDLEQFSEMLSVNPNRLRQCFFDQLQIHVEESYSQLKNDGIKICPECLAKGYHCIFFELGFIDICPWHHIALEQACADCLRAVYSKGLQFNRRQNHLGQVNPDDLTKALGEWKSICNHLVFEVDIVRKLNQMSQEQELEINHKCRLLYGWIKTAQTRLDLTGKLYCYTNLGADGFEKFFNAAEKIAGACPWPVNHKRSPVKWILLNERQKSTAQTDESFHRNPDLDSIYKSIRRHIFTRYVKNHRACHKGIINLKRDESLSLDTEKVCSIALAYNVWRLKIEKFINVEALKQNVSLNRVITPPDFYVSDIPLTTELQANFLYLQFFYIWEQIDRNIGKNSIAINSTGLPYQATDMALTYARGNLSIIFAQPEHLTNRAFKNCVERYKVSQSLQNQRFSRIWGYGHYDNLMSNQLGLMFKLTKFQSVPAQRSIIYINV